jgi:hypothetical protein
LIFKKMTDIEKCLAGNADDGSLSLIGRELLSRAPRVRETKSRHAVKRDG